MTELLKQLDHNQIKQLTEELNQLVPKEEAAVQIEFDDTTGGYDLIANQSGFLRLGIELLKAAYTPCPSGLGKKAIVSDIEYLLKPDPQKSIKEFFRQDELFTIQPVSPTEQRSLSYTFWAMVVSYFILIFICILALIGSYTVIKLVVSTFY